MFAGKAIHAFQLNNQFAFDEDVGKVLSDMLPLIRHRK
jgi:hypothetical protein